MKSFYFYIFFILLLTSYVIFTNKNVELFEFFVTTTTNNSINNKEIPMNPTKKVTIASLKDTLVEDDKETKETNTDNVDNTDNTDTSETEEESVMINNNKITKCPEGYAYIKNSCQEVCHNCKLGKCEYGICY